MESIETRTESSTKKFPDHLQPGWRDLLKNEVDESYFKTLMDFMRKEYARGATIYPARENIFRAFQEIDFQDVKVVIIGQDPYHGANQAIGRSFAVPNALFPKPPSLQNILKELRADVGVAPAPEASELGGWVSQGVFLLNAVLTVRAGEAFSHRDQGWETFTNRVIEKLGARPEPMAFILWGAAAQGKRTLIGPQHFRVESPHPSPLSAHRGFFGSKPFSRVNEFLASQGKTPIDWAKVD